MKDLPDIEFKDIPGSPSYIDGKEYYICGLAEDIAGDPDLMVEYFGDNPDVFMDYMTHRAMASSATTNDKRDEHREDAETVYIRASRDMAEQKFNEEQRLQDDEP